jgi:ELWxxDGT repeat protein
MTPVQGNLFFVTANVDKQYDLELWKSDGTAEGTVMVKSKFAEPRPAHLDELTAVGPTLFFLVNDFIHGKVLWKSDGTAAGTVMVKDFTP